MQHPVSVQRVIYVLVIAPFSNNLLQYCTYRVSIMYVQNVMFSFMNHERMTKSGSDIYCFKCYGLIEQIMERNLLQQGKGVVT